MLSNEEAMGLLKVIGAQGFILTQLQEHIQRLKTQIASQDKDPESNSKTDVKLHENL